MNEAYISDGGFVVYVSDENAPSPPDQRVGDRWHRGSERLEWDGTEWVPERGPKAADL